MVFYFRVSPLLVSEEVHLNGSILICLIEHRLSINGYYLPSLLPLLFGVPQGSVLGPQFFTFYSSPIASMVYKYTCMLMIHTIYILTYMTLVMKLLLVLALNYVFNDIKMWMTVNKLKLNDDKTELLIMSSKYHQSKLTTNLLQIASSNIHASSNARNLGIRPFYKARAPVRLRLPVTQESTKSLKALLVLHAKTLELTKRSIMQVIILK